MTISRYWLAPAAIGLLWLQTSCLVHSGSDSVPSPCAFVAVEIPSSDTDPTPAVPGLDPDRRYPAGSRVVLLGTGDGPPRVLSPGLHAAGRPAVAADGRRLLFAGKARADSVWSIYETSTGAGSPRELVRADSDCIDPSYVGGGRLVFVCRAGDGEPADRWALHSAGEDGSDIQRISFSPGAAGDPSPLRDGRVLFALRQQPGIGRQRISSALFTVNPDGTLIDAFLGSHESEDLLRAREAADGGVWFLVRDAAEPGPWIERAEINEPRRTRRRVDLGLDEEIFGVEPTADGGLLVSGRSGIWRFGPEPGNRLLVAAASRGMLVDAVPVEARTAPRGRPSAVDPNRHSATIVGYDAARTDGSIVVLPAGVRPARMTVEQFGRSPLGTLVLDADGSFFVEVPADRPIRLRSKSGDGRDLAVSDWLWLRPGEVRACFGCHESRDAAPSNRAIAALRHEPIRVGDPDGSR